MPFHHPGSAVLKGTRSRIVDLLRRSTLTANELAARLGLTRPRWCFEIGGDVQREARGRSAHRPAR